MRSLLQGIGEKTLFRQIEGIKFLKLKDRASIFAKVVANHQEQILKNSAKYHYLSEKILKKKFSRVNYMTEDRRNKPLTVK